MIDIDNYLEFIDRYDKIDSLKDKIITDIFISRYKDFILFKLENNENYLMYHEQDCCESVLIDEIHGDLSNIIGSKIIIAEEVEGEAPSVNDDYFESYTWTFYKLATIKGYVTIRWFGESNGYYSESVDIAKVKIKQSNSFK